MIALSQQWDFRGSCTKGGHVLSSGTSQPLKSEATVRHESDKYHNNGIDFSRRKVSLVGAATSIIFVATNVFVCRDKTRLLSRQKYAFRFVVTKV